PFLPLVPQPPISTLFPYTTLFRSVSWHNFDTDPHFIALVPGLSTASNGAQTDINPVDIGVNRIAGTDDVPGGDTITVIFSKPGLDRKSTRLNSSHVSTSYAVFCLK